jgi:hypothetical protein
MSPHWKPIAAVTIFLAVAAPARAALTISSQPTQGVECASGVCTATVQNAVLNAEDLTSLLAESDLSVESGKLAKSIVVAAHLHLLGANMLTLDSVRAILVDRPIFVDGRGGLAFRFNTNRENGDLRFGLHGQVTFGNTSAQLTINGKQYALIDSIAALASGVSGDPHGYFALANDYDASSDGVYSNAPVPKFRGNFEGLGHTISGLSINDQSRGGAVGLIGVQADGVVRDIGMANVTVIGGVAGRGGALVGENEGTILNSLASGAVTLGKRAYAGGLVGLNFNDIDRCHANVFTTGGSRSIVGGLVGFNVGAHGTINRSSSAGNVVAQTGAIAGGLAGATTGRIWESFATGNTMGGDKAIVGGLTGYNAGGNFGRIIASYETGSVAATTNSAVGGLAGFSSGTILESYSTGMVSGKTKGGFLGYDGADRGNFTSYWDRDSSGIRNPGRGAGNIVNDPGITGLTTAQFQAGLPPDFDPRIWKESPDKNGGLPYLKENPPQQQQ